MSFSAPRPRRLVSRLVLGLSLLGVPVAVAATAASDAEAAPPKKDPLADKFGNAILFLDSSPPAVLGGPAWFQSHQIKTKEENSDKKWPLHVMIFLAKALDVNKLDLMVYKIDKKGNKEFVQKLEQFPSGDGRSFYFQITLRKETPYEPNLKYTIKVEASTGAIAESKEIELTGKEEPKIGGGPIDFTGGMDLSKPKEEKPTGPFVAAAAKEVLDKVIYEDCKTSASKGGAAKIQIKFAAKDGKVLQAEFVKDPPAPYSDATQTCIAQRFKKAKIKPFTGEDKTTTYTTNL
jgi:hypothetical protein